MGMKEYELWDDGTPKEPKTETTAAPVQAVEDTTPSGDAFDGGGGKADGGGTAAGGDTSALGDKGDSAAVVKAADEEIVPKDGYERLFMAANKKPLSEEERQAQMKRDKRNMNLAALGDAIIIASNLAATSMGAPNGYDGTHTLSQAQKEQAEKHWQAVNNYQQWYNQQRDAAAKADDKAAMDRGKFELLQAKADAQVKYQAAREELATAQAGLAQAKKEAAEQKAKIDAELAAGKIALQEAQARKLAVDAAISEEWGARLKAAELQERQARANASNATAAWRRNYSGGNGRARYEFDGTYYETSEAYKTAVMKAAREYGVPTTEETVKTTANGRGKETKRERVTRQRSVNAIAGDVLRKIEQEREMKDLHWGEEETEETDW